MYDDKLKSQAQKTWEMLQGLILQSEKQNKEFDRRLIKTNQFLSEKLQETERILSEKSQETDQKFQETYALIKESSWKADKYLGKMMHNLNL